MINLIKTLKLIILPKNNKFNKPIFISKNKYNNNSLKNTVKYLYLKSF